MRRPTEMDWILAAEGVTVRFGGVAANNGVSFWCTRGEITAVIGPNGAGKTTLFNAITGARAPDAGEITFLGQRIEQLPAWKRARLGMARTFQTPALIPNGTVVENVVVGASRYLGYGTGSALLGLPGVRRTDRQLEGIARWAMRAVGIDEVRNRLVGNLPYGLVRRVEIARALALGPELLLLDEPAAGMDHVETEELADLLTAARQTWGLTILLVEHDLSLVKAVADQAFVLDFGEVIASGGVQEVLHDPKVMAAYLGPHAIGRMAQTPPGSHAATAVSGEL
ncbi:MAG: branched-chain amino acid transport system ATP-binding protein [Actinomycetota bacterium]|nr:branched-chain amino acid transport system ATP-binding protein [Actinomycetota bacterium]